MCNAAQTVAEILLGAASAETPKLMGEALPRCWQGHCTVTDEESGQPPVTGHFQLFAGHYGPGVEYVMPDTDGQGQPRPCVAFDVYGGRVRALVCDGETGDVLLSVSFDAKGRATADQA